MADRPTITALRKLAREALGKTAAVYETGGVRRMCLAYKADAARLEVRAGRRSEARRQLRQLLQDIVTGRGLREEDSNGCPP